MPDQASNWKLPKVHSMSHYSRDVMRAGVTAEYSAEMWERTHKTTIKGHYRGSNKKKTDIQILKKHSMYTVLYEHDRKDGYFKRNQKKRSSNKSWEEVCTVSKILFVKHFHS